MNASIRVDARLFREEIASAKAHACALRQAGVYTSRECEKVRAALCQIEGEIAGGKLPTDGVEDIHTLIENRLTELTGDAGAKIQTARSRNEQTQVAQRLFLKDALDGLIFGVQRLQEALCVQAETHLDVLMPGYTHTRPALPLRFAHYLCAHFFGLERDKGRLRDAHRRIDTCPAGSSALAGATFPLDRDALAEALGFAAPSENALDTVSDRDGQLEALAALAILMVRLSRLAEDLILWSSPSFGFVELEDTYCTSSSRLPQKKNPDSLELVRGKCGRVVADLVSLLVTCKGLPTGYQKDLQEDKEPLFDAVDTVRDALTVTAGVMGTLGVNPENMKAAIPEECLATDQADALVEEGIPFREAFAIVAEAFQTSENNGTAKKKRRRGAKSRAAEALTPEGSVERRDLPGGTSRRAVLEQLQQARAVLRA
jgi:argininosuccinate lyase